MMRLPGYRREASANITARFQHQTETNTWVIQSRHGRQLLLFFFFLHQPSGASWSYISYVAGNTVKPFENLIFHPNTTPPSNAPLLRSFLRFLVLATIWDSEVHKKARPTWKHVYRPRPPPESSYTMILPSISYDSAIHIIVNQSYSTGTGDQSNSTC